METYLPKNVCARKIQFEVDEYNCIQNVVFTGGCDGNHKGICKLVEGMKIDDVIKRLNGISCNGRSTSCPDQLAKALMLYKENKKIN